MSSCGAACRSPHPALLPTPRPCRRHGPGHQHHGHAWHRQASGVQSGGAPPRLPALPACRASLWAPAGCVGSKRLRPAHSAQPVVARQRALCPAQACRCAPATSCCPRALCLWWPTPWPSATRRSRPPSTTTCVSWSAGAQLQGARREPALRCTAPSSWPRRRRRQPTGAFALCTRDALPAAPPPQAGGRRAGDAAWAEQGAPSGQVAASWARGRHNAWVVCMPGRGGRGSLLVAPPLRVALPQRIMCPVP